MLQPGALFQNNYTIEGELGQGAFAVVYLARDRSLGRQVAIKVLKEGRSNDRFFREAKLLSELRSPHTVTLIEVGRAGADEQPFMVFEYVPGETLEARLARVGAMPGGRVAHIIRQVLSSLAEAHERGIVHRDVKPANIMMTDRDGNEDFVKVLDFGVAKPLDDVRDVSVELTMAGQIIGTMRYMAPEQLKGERKAIPASDVYAVGLIAYELLNNEKAATGDDAHYVLAQHLSAEPFVLSEHLDLPLPFRRAFEAMMSKELSFRPRDASEALRTLSSSDDDSTTFDKRIDLDEIDPERQSRQNQIASRQNQYGSRQNQHGSRQNQHASRQSQHARSDYSADQEVLSIDADALAQNRARVTRGVTAALPQQPQEDEGDARVSTILFVAVAVVAFGLIVLLLSVFSR